MKKRIIPFFAFLLIFLLVGCGTSKPVNSPTKPQIVVSFYPLEDFAKKIGGNYVNVVNLVPPGTEPHDFEPSPQDMKLMINAKLLVYNGAGLESWVEQALTNIDKTKTIVVNTSQKMKLRKPVVTEDEHKHENEVYDPHIWLDPYLAEEQAKLIRDAMIQMDPSHKTVFEANYQKLAQKFQQLKTDYQVLLHTPKREFVTSHTAFSYLANRYHLQQIPITGITPEDEPSASELTSIVQTIQKHNIHVIFFETLVSNKIANVVKNETKTTALVLNPLEGLTSKEISQGDDYFSIMNKNLINLKQALEYKQ
jgi:zinc transport system substrate-binding protein